jgi:hypothetical protein
MFFERLMMDERQPTTMIALRLPADILARLPEPSGQRTGKAGTGRAGAIVELLRRALQETQPDGGENSSPAFLSN